MFCPYCHGEDTKVVDKRDNPETGVTRRRRECLSCEKRFTTYERIEEIPLNVEKKDGKIVDFDRNKLKNSILKSIKKRSITDEQIEEIIDDIEQKLLNRKKNIVKSNEIGKLVLTRLKKIDNVAYLRYISVYESFDSLDNFKKEIENLLKENGHN